MRILTIREPMASALLYGVYDAERRKYRLNGPTLIHAASEPAMDPSHATAWYRERGDETAARLMEWRYNDATMPSDEDVIDSPMDIGLLGSIRLHDGMPYRFGRIIGMVDGWDPVREGVEWANRPVGCHPWAPSEGLPKWRGRLGPMIVPESLMTEISRLRESGMIVDAEWA